MTIKDSFILCAGKGTRMGEVGELLAKPLWPVFEKTLLELQLEYLKKYGCTGYNVNTHHLHEQVLSQCKEIKNKVNVFHEEKLLGSGGCFHNIKKNEKSLNKIISLNSDIQIFLNDFDKKNLMLAFEKHDYVLVCLPVKKGSAYNEVCVDKDGFFAGVRPPNDKSDYITYSGFGMISLSLLEYVDGESSFFDTVISKSLNKTKIFVPSGPYEYWDWGTKELYISNIKKLSSESVPSILRKLLIETGALREHELGASGYRSEGSGVYNFSGTEDTSMYRDSILLTVGDNIEALAF